MANPVINLPKVVLVKDVADAVGWSVQRTRRWLKALKALEKRGRKYVTTKKRLQLVFPEAYDALEGQNDD